jgi:hypothetical protein
MTSDKPVQYFDVARRLLDESGQHQGRVRRTLERLSAVYQRRACEALSTNDNHMVEGGALATSLTTEWGASPAVRL